MHAAGKILVKTFLKAIRDFFFSQYVELPNLCYFYTTEGEVQTPLASPVPSSIGTS